MAAGVGQAQLTLDGNDIPGAILDLDANGNASVPFDSTNVPVGTHNISSRFIPASGSNQKPSSDPNGRTVAVDNPLVPTSCSTGAISPNEFPQGAKFNVLVSVTT